MSDDFTLLDRLLAGLRTAETQLLTLDEQISALDSAISEGTGPLITQKMNEKNALEAIRATTRQQIIDLGEPCD